MIAQEASSIKGASNQVLPSASAIVSCRIVPDQKPEHVLEKLTAFLKSNPPWGCHVEVAPAGPPVDWWMTDPNGPAFEAALSAMRQGFDRDPVAIGCGGTIGFVGPLSDLFGRAPALLMTNVPVPELPTALPWKAKDNIYALGGASWVLSLGHGLESPKGAPTDVKTWSELMKGDADGRDENIKFASTSTGEGRVPEDFAVIVDPGKPPAGADPTKVGPVTKP